MRYREMEDERGERATEGEAGRERQRGRKAEVYFWDYSAEGMKIMI